MKQYYQEVQEEILTLYKYDLHVHTSETSHCGKVAASEMVDLYIREGYSGIVVTDHYYEGFFKKLEMLSWDEKVDKYLEGYYKAYEASDGKKFDVLLGIELTFDESYNDYLVFGADEYFLRKNKELYNLGLNKFRELISGMEMLIFQAHPFRPRMTRAECRLLDGVEVYNGNPRHDSNNAMAYQYAVENGLMMTSGSDFHQVCDLARGGIEIDRRITTSGELVELIKSSGVRNLIKKGEI